jgi:hypothetical protein
MSQIGRWIGVLFLAGGAALGALAYRAQRAAAAAAETRAAETQAAAAAEKQRLEGEVRAAEARGARAAALEPLNAAIASHVDGATLLDLFDHEEWWQSFRDELAGARVILGDEMLAEWRKPDIGAADAPVVRAARERRLAAARLTAGGQEVVVVAARLEALPERVPIIVLVRRVPASTAAAVAPLPPSGPLEGPAAFAAAGALLVFGLGLAVAGGKKREPGALVAVEIPREPTLRFGTPARPVPAVNGHSGSRAPMTAAGAGVSVPGGSGSRAPAVTPPASGTQTAALMPPIEPGAVVDPAPRLDSGRTFGRYRLLERLGEGGMSEVYTAVAKGVEGFSRTFVLKRLRPELAREREAIAQFIDEARLQAGLVHSNIVPVFDFGMVGNGEYFMTQEYIVGRDLLRVMTKHLDHASGGIDPHLTYYVAHETLQALAYAHDFCDKEGQPMHLVHRDVSPGNLMISLRGEVKLADFGIVKASRRVSRTQMGMVKGNANFMSPEQARGQDVDARSDLFSLATVMFYCLTGQLLYGGDNDLDVLYKAARGPTPEDMVRIAMLPDPAASLLAKALAFDPNDRFQSAAEFADQLAAFVGAGKAQAASLVQTLFGDELRRRAA